MKLVILAGGKGTRLGLSDIPKPMVMIGEKPLLQHQIELAKSYGINDIIILSGHLAEVIFNYFKDGTDFGVKITHIIEPYPLGTAGSIKLVEHLICDKRFLVFYGDIMMNFDIKTLLEFDKKHKSIATLVIHPNDHPHDSDLLEVDSAGYIKAFYSKPHKKNEYYHNLVNAAVYILSKKVFSYIGFGQQLDFGKELFPKLLNENEMLVGYKTTEYIKDVGTIERLIKVESDYLSGKVEKLNKRNKRKAVFLDRDGVINEEVNLLHKIDDFKLLPKVGKAIKKINSSEYLAVVVTNQPVIARNLCTIEELDKIHKKMETSLGIEGAYLDGIYFCPHHPDRGYPEENPNYKIKCKCRKPEVGLIRMAIKDLNIDIKGSYIIGDTERDVMCGKKAGLITIGVRTGYGSKNLKTEPDYYFDTLLDAVNFIVNEPFTKYLFEIKRSINETKNKPYIITVGGNSRSGKTTFCNYIKQKLTEDGFKVCHILLDNWLLPNTLRGNSMNVLDRFQTDKIKSDFEKLLKKKNIKLHRYEPLNRSLSKENVIYTFNNFDVVLVDGVVALSIQTLRQIANLKIYCKISEAKFCERFKKFYRWKGLSDKEIEELYKIRKLDEFDIINNDIKYADLILEESYDNS